MTLPVCFFTQTFVEGKTFACRNAVRFSRLTREAWKRKPPALGGDGGKTRKEKREEPCGRGSCGSAPEDVGPQQYSIDAELFLDEDSHLGREIAVAVLEEPHHLAGNPEFVGDVLL